MQTITPHLWFDKEAKEAAEFYVSVFSAKRGSDSSGKDSRVKNITTLHNTPSGTVDLVTIELSRQQFALISAGPLFKFNPSVSFLVACKTKDEVDAIWEKLSEGGTALMAWQISIQRKVWMDAGQVRSFVASDVHGRS